MDDQKALIGSLKAYYSEHGIGAENFRCRHEPECRGSLPIFDPSAPVQDSFSPASEPWTGPRFGETEVPRIPRLVFVSLDSGDAGAEAGSSAIEVRDGWAPGVWVATPKEKRRHWFCTCEIARRLIRTFRSSIADIPIEDAQAYFAHTNSARCCQNKRGNRQADPVLFDNCRKFVGPELEIFRPDVLISQGDYAKDAVVKHFSPPLRTVRTWPDKLGACRVLRIAGQECLWYHTYHPNQGVGFFWKQREQVILPDDGLSCVVRDFITTRDGGNGSAEGA
jgi:hypothetical protein